jgi:ZIP family zinc transporter
MREFLIVMGLAALPALANFAGGGLGEAFRVSGRALSLSLHLAAGVVLAAVGLELMPTALCTGAPWVPLPASPVPAPHLQRPTWRTVRAAALGS